MAVPQMSPDFARWYFELFMDEGEMRGARWKAVTELGADADQAAIEVLVRLAFAFRNPAGHKNETLTSAHSKIVETFSADPSFQVERAARELQVLAAATLVRLFESDADAALAVSTASFGGKRTPDLPMDIALLAKQALSRLSAKQHDRPDSDELAISRPQIEFEVDQETVDNNTGAMWKTTIEGLRDEIAAAFDKLVDDQNEVVCALSRRIELGEEELQMVWWLTGGRSVSLDKSFGTIEAALKPLALAHELGEMTNHSPGPASVSAILAKAGAGKGILKVADAAGAVSLEWASDATSPAAISPMTTPLHFALEKRVEFGDGEAWQGVWSAETGLDANASLSAIELAEIFYREHLFLNV